VSLSNGSFDTRNNILINSSVSSSFPIQHSICRRQTSACSPLASWTFDVRCSFFFSKPATVPQRINNLALMGFIPAQSNS
jgi:hypothetical protein